MKVVLLTWHDGESPRKVDFHFWAEVLSRRGTDVDFVTVGFSPATLLRPHRFSYPRPYNQWVRVNDHMRKFVWFPPFHPFNLNNALLNRLSTPIFRLYGRLMSKTLLKGMGNPDVFVVENGAGLALIPRLARLFPKAKIIYSVCDRIETLDYHPVIVDAEKTALKHIDNIRVPAVVMVDDYKTAEKFHEDVRFIPHGLDKAIFDRPSGNPYSSPRNIVSIGDMLFDAEAVQTIANAYPDWTIHLFGKGAKLPAALPNVIAYGERPFDELVPYIQHADIGLAPYRPGLNADYLSQSSMKMIQYTYCRLPIVAPAFAAAGPSHILPYEPGNAPSIVSAVKAAIAFPRDQIDRSAVLDWDKTVDLMLA